jgi:hypothetical protein
MGTQAEGHRPCALLSAAQLWRFKRTQQDLGHGRPCKAAANYNDLTRGRSVAKIAIGTSVKEFSHRTGHAP